MRSRAAAIRSPSSVIRHQEWYLQESGLRPERTDDLGMLFRLAPRFIARECTALVDPSGVPAAQADHMRDDDVVVGIALGGAARAYPWWIMDNHHLANDVVGGRPVALAFCEMCSSAIALDPIVDGHRLIFDPNHVYNGMPAMQDRATRSVWAPYLARAIRGRGDRSSLVAAMRRAADALGLRFVLVETDVRAFSDPFAPWSAYHGAALAATALLLAPTVGRALVPGDASYDDPSPFGSHPLLDPLWSTERVDVVFDGFEAGRLDKVRIVAGSEVALRYLHVCPRGWDATNCGHCEKCQRTMAALRAVGALERSATLPHDLDLDAVAARAVRNPKIRTHWAEIVRSLDEEGRDAELARAIRASLDRGSRRGLGRARWRFRRSRRGRSRRRRRAG
jgi:hypothetical protein